MVCLAQEAGREQHQLATRGLGVGLPFEFVLDDLLDAPRVVELEVQRTPAGGVDTLAAVLVRQAQQLLRLAQLGPREVAGE